MLINTKTTGELYNILAEEGLYTKSFDEFKAKYSNTQSINKLHALMRRDGLYQGDNESFYQTYFADKNPYNIITSKEKEKETNVKIPPREEPSGFFNLGEFMYDVATKPVETFQKTVETVKDKAYDAKKSVSREYNKLKFGDDFKEEVFEHNYDKENPIIGYFDSDEYDKNIDIGKLEEDKRKFESKIRNFAEVELAEDMNNKVFKVIDDVEKSYARRKKEQQDLIPQFFGKYENGVFVPGEYENLDDNQKLQLDRMLSDLSMSRAFGLPKIIDDSFKGNLLNSSIISYNKKNGTNFKLKDLSSNEDFYNYVTKSYISSYGSYLDGRIERRKKKKVKEYLKEEGGDTFLGEGEERLTYKENAKKLADKYQPVYNELKKGADNLITRVESASYIAERESEWLNKNSPELVLARYKARKYYSQEDINNAQAEYTEYFNEYNSRLKNLQNQLIIAEELQNILRPSMEKILVLEDELKDIGIVGELASTNYSWGSQLRTKITTGFYSTFIGMNEALKRYGQLAQEDSLPGFLDDIKNGLVKAIVPTTLNNALTKKAADWYIDRSTDTDFTKGLKNLNDYVVSTQMDEKDMHWSLRTLGDMAQMAPQILLASTGVGTVGVLGSMSLSAAGNSFIDLEKKYMNDYAKLKGIDYSDVNPNSKEFKDLYNIKLYASATFHGSMEGISETVGGIFGSRAILKTLGGRIPTYGVKRYMGKTLGLATYVTAESGIEGFTEGLSTFSTNVFDKYVFNEKVDVWDGVSESFYRGALASGGYKAPLILKQTFTPFISNMTQENLAATAQRLREIDSQLLDVKLQADKKSQLIKEAERLVNANIDLYDKAIKSSASLSNKQRSDLIKIQTDNYKITQKAREIKNSEKLSKNEKNLQLKSLKNQYSVNQGKKSDILKTLDKLTDAQKEKAWNTQVSIIRQNAKLAEQEGSKPINVIETNTDGMQQYLIDDATADITQADAVVQSMRQVVKDKNSTREEKIEAQEILNEYKKQKPVNQYIQMIKGKASDYGMMVPKFNSKGEITSFDIVLNKQTSLEDGMLNTAAHEFLHVTFYNTLKQDPAAQRVLGDSLLNIIQNDADVTYTELGLNTINQRLQQYDVYGEEVFTVVSELMLENQVIFKETGLRKIAGIFRRFAQNHLGRDIKFNTEQDIKNFIIDYHKSIKNNKPNKAIARMVAKGAKGNLVAHAKTLQEREEQAKFVSSVRITNNNNPDLKNEFDDLVFKEDGLTPKFKNNEEFRLSPEYSKGYEKIMNTNLLNGLIQQGMIERGLPTEALMEFTRKVKEKISERYLKNYNVSKNDSLFGWLTGVSGGAGKSIIYRAKGDVIKEYVKERQADQLSIDRPVGEAGTLADVLEADVTQQQEFEKKDVSLAAKKTRKIVLADRLGVTKKVANAIEKIAPELNVEKLTFKTLKNKIPEITGELFGIAPKKLITNANITKSELQSSQMFISKNADLLIAMLPDGATASGTATGVPNTLLKAFYTKTDRTKMAKTGSKAGLAVQQKNNITKKQFLEVFGIVDGKPNRTDRNTSARVLSLANTLGKVMTNQAVRQELGKQGESAKQIIAKLKDGNSNIVFSKRLQKKAGNQKRIKVSQDLFKQIRSENFKHGYISKIFGSNVLNSQQIMRPSGKTKILKTVTDRDLEGPYLGKTKESGADYRNRVANNFLKQFPQHREILRSTMAGGIGLSLFRTTGEFDLAVPETNVDQSSTTRFYPHAKGSKLKPNLLELLNTKEQKLNQKNKIPVFNQFLRDVQTYLTQNNNENILDVGFFEELTKDTQNNQGSVTRISAPYLSYPVKNGKLVTNELATEEHSFPNIDMGRAGIFAAASGNLDAITPIIEATYMQMSLLNTDDNIVNYMYSSSMPDVFYEQIIPRILNGDLANLPAGYVAFVRYAAAKGKKGERINLNNYKLLDGQTVAQFFGVDGIVNPETGMPDIAAQNDTIIDQLTGKVAANFGENISRVKLSKKAGIHLKLQKLKTIARSKRTTEKSRGMSAFDFDETLIDKGKNTIIAKKGDDVVEISSGNWPLQGPELAKQGYEFDFSDFVNVKGGVAGPLMQKFRNRIAKYGIKNNYILTARPQESAPAIQAWLKTQGIDMPIENITGLGNSTGEAKALWVANKYSEGYNDIYFVDDALPNVTAVADIMNQLDIKGKSVQAKIQSSKKIQDKIQPGKDVDGQFNKILEDVTGIDSKKRFSDIKARKRGASKGKFRFFIPPSHEDFVGLLYNFMGKGRVGDAHRDFFEQNLIRPLNRAYREIDTAKQAIANDYKSLNKEFKSVKDKLKKKTPDGDFTFEDAVRVYIWTKHNYEIPGLSQTDQTYLAELVSKDGELQAYAETINLISKQETYVDPGLNWEGGNIKTDLIDATGRVGRAEYFKEFAETSDIIFNEANLNKIEAAYGASFRSALEDMLHAIKTGINRPKGQSGTINKFMNYLNGSVGAVMFFNMRSAILQQMSIVNYINFADNNPLAAAKAFANQKQYWADFAFIFNSDMLKQRRGGIGTDINGAELAEAVAKAGAKGVVNQTKVVIAKLLKLGFLPTQIGDNIAIATGGATFYRNRVNKYIKEGLSKKEAESKAFTDFQDVTQSTQQSSRPDMTSQQQRSWIGKLVLNFQNITSQYNRIIKKSASDIYNRRMTPPYKNQFQSDASNMSRILYYGAIQNVVFYALQTALFAVMFGSDNEEDEKFLQKGERVVNGTFDSILRGSGIYGVAVSTLKNMAIKYHEQRDKKYNKDESAVLMEALNFSPVVGIKARKIVNAEKTINYNENVISEMQAFDADNPGWSAATNYIEALTNFPANRLYQKSINIRNSLDNDYESWQRALFFSGYTTWSLGLDDTKKMQEIKKNVKLKKQKEAEERAKIKREESKRKKEKEQEAQVKENIKKSKKDGRCAAINSSGERCSNEAVAGGFCTIHEKKEQRTDGKQVQCSAKKSDGTRCKMQTTNKSGKCYYHD